MTKELDENPRDDGSADFVPAQIIARPQKNNGGREGAYVMVLRSDIKVLGEGDVEGSKFEPGDFSKLWNVKLRELPIIFFSENISDINEGSFLPVQRVVFAKGEIGYNYSVEGSLKFKVGDRPVEISYSMDGASGRFTVRAVQKNAKDISFMAEQLASFLNSGEVAGRLKTIIDNHFFQKIPLSEVEVTEEAIQAEEPGLPIAALRLRTAMKLGTIVVPDKFGGGPIVIR